MSVLNSNKLWNAKWIWAVGEVAPWNVAVNFRGTFEPTADSAAAQLHISADSRYILYVNGARLGYGPARAYQFNYQYDTYPLADYLMAGKNLIAVSVLDWGEGNFQSLVGRGGLVVQLDDGPLLASSASWRVKRNAAYRQDVLRISPQLAWEELWCPVLATSLIQACFREIPTITPRADSRDASRSAPGTRRSSL